MAKVYITGSVKNVRALYSNHLKLVNEKAKIRKWLEETVQILWTGYQIANPGVVVELTNFHPNLIGASSEAVFATTVSYKEIEEVILEEYGFFSWDDVQEAGSFNPLFEQAVNVALQGDIATMQTLLDKDPTIISETSSFGHKASIIQYLAANGVEMWRQYVSQNVIEMLELLIEFGANPNTENNIFGGSTLRTLIETSEHSFKSGKTDEMLDRLAVYGY